ncbi:MAG: hypothetical protein ING37_11695 [Rhodocyclaceae bacterium]|nr:hypothetical protein [Rhodocyclaceae bacterium]
MTPSQIQHLDAVAGAQLATFAAVVVLLKRQSTDPGLIPDLQAAFERLQSAALGSQSSDYKLQALAESAEALLQAAQPPG